MSSWEFFLLPVISSSSVRYAAAGLCACSGCTVGWGRATPRWRSLWLERRRVWVGTQVATSRQGNRQQGKTITWTKLVFFHNNIAERRAKSSLHHPTGDIQLLITCWGRRWWGWRPQAPSPLLQRLKFLQVV